MWFGRALPAKAERDAKAAKTDNQAGHRTGDRDPEFRFRIRGVLLDLGNATEREQGDRSDLQPPLLGNQRMGKFMQQQADEEEESGEQRSDPNLACAPTRVHLVEVSTEGEHDQ